MKLNKVQKLYYLLFISISLGFIFSFKLPFGIKLYLYDIFAIIISFVSFFYIWHLKKFFSRFYYLIVFLFFGFIGLFFSIFELNEFLESSAYFLRIFIYLLLIIPVFFFKKNHVKKIINSIFISGIIFLGIGYVQYIFYPDLANLYYLGWDRHLYRLFSSFFDPNFTGIYLVILYLISISYLFTMNTKSKFKKIFMISILYLPAIFLTYSRTTYISLLISTIVFMYFVNKKIIFLGLAIFILAIFAVPKNYGGEGVNLLRTQSVISRLKEYENALSLFVQYPFTGVGFNAVKFSRLKDKSISLESLSSNAANGFPNSYLFALVTTGLIGCMSLFYFIFQILKKLIIPKNNEYYIFSSGVFSSLVCVLIASFFENVLFFSPITIILIVLVSSAIKLSGLEDNS